METKIGVMWTKARGWRPPPGEKKNRVLGPRASRGNSAILTLSQPSDMNLLLAFRPVRQHISVFVSHRASFPHNRPHSRLPRTLPFIACQESSNISSQLTVGSHWVTVISTPRFQSQHMESYFLWVHPYQCVWPLLYHRFWFNTLRIHPYSYSPNSYQCKVIISCNPSASKPSLWSDLILLFGIHWHLIYYYYFIFLIFIWGYVFIDFQISRKRNIDMRNPNLGSNP